MGTGKGWPTGRALWLGALALCAMLAPAVSWTQQSRGADGCINGQGSGCNTRQTGSGTSSSGTRSGASDANTQATQQVLQGAAQMLGDWAEEADRRSRQRLLDMERQQQDEERQRRQRQADLLREFEQQQQQARQEGGSSSDNPFSASGGQGGGATGGSAAATELDPQEDYAGKSCSYFTCRAVRDDGSAINAREAVALMSRISGFL